jgi:hypothetical protein
MCGVEPTHKRTPGEAEAPPLLSCPIGHLTDLSKQPQMRHNLYNWCKMGMLMRTVSASEAKKGLAAVIDAAARVTMYAL